MQKFSSVISNVLYESLIKKKGSELASIILNWKGIVGKEYFSSTYPYKIITSHDELLNKKNKYLIVFAENQVISTGFMYSSNLFIEKLNLCLGYVAIKKIKTQVENHFFQNYQRNIDSDKLL
jgi:hypothetical protein